MCHAFSHLLLLLLFFLRLLCYARDTEYFEELLKRAPPRPSPQRGSPSSKSQSASRHSREDEHHRASSAHSQPNTNPRPKVEEFWHELLNDDLPVGRLLYLTGGNRSPPPPPPIQHQQDQQRQQKCQPQYQPQPWMGDVAGPSSSTFAVLGGGNDYSNSLYSSGFDDETTTASFSPYPTSSFDDFYSSCYSSGASSFQTTDYTTQGSYHTGDYYPAVDSPFRAPHEDRYHHQVQQTDDDQGQLQTHTDTATTHGDSASSVSPRIERHREQQADARRKGKAVAVPRKSRKKGRKEQQETSPDEEEGDRDAAAAATSRGRNSSGSGYYRANVRDMKDWKDDAQSREEYRRASVLFESRKKPDDMKKGGTPLRMKLTEKDRADLGDEGQKLYYVMTNKYEHQCNTARRGMHLSGKQGRALSVEERRQRRRQSRGDFTKQCKRLRAKLQSIEDGLHEGTFFDSLDLDLVLDLALSNDALPLTERILDRFLVLAKKIKEDWERDPVVWYYEKQKRPEIDKYVTDLVEKWLSFYALATLRGDNHHRP